MTDVEYIFYLQEKRSKKLDVIHNKIQDIVERINSNAVPGVTYDINKIRNNSPQNYIENLFIEYEEISIQTKGYEKYFEEFKKFLRPLEELVMTEREVHTTRWRRYHLTEAYYTLWPTYRTAGSVLGVSARAAENHIINALKLMNENYKNIDLFSEYPILYEIM